MLYFACHIQHVKLFLLFLFLVFHGLVSRVSVSDACPWGDNLIFISGLMLCQQTNVRKTYYRIDI